MAPRPLTQSLPNLPIQVEFGLGTPLQAVNGVLYTVGSGIATAPGGPGKQAPPSTNIVLALNAHDGSVVWLQQFNGNAQPNFEIAP